MKFLKAIRDLVVVKRAAEPEQQLLLDYAKKSDVEALFIVVGMLAKCGGEVSPRQADIVQRFIKLHLADSLHELAQKAFREGQEYNLVKGAIVHHTFTLYWSGSQLWIDPLQVLDLLLRVAFADGDYSPWEEYIVDTARATLAMHIRIYWALRDQLARQFGIEVPREGACFADAADWEELKEQARARKVQQARTAQQVERPPAPRETAYAALGLAEGASSQEVKKAYRLLVKKYHPDSLGASELGQQEYQGMAEQFLQIQAAYETLLG